MIMDDRKMMKEIGIKIIEIIPPESKWKNKPQREARDGKPQLLSTFDYIYEILGIESDEEDEFRQNKN